MRLTTILESYSTMMILGLLLGLVLGGFPWFTKEISMGSLALLMTISLSNVKLGETRGKDHLKDALLALALNYGLLTIVILAFGSVFDEKLRWGFVLMAAAPSAISIVPFTTILGGRTSRALFSTAVNYIAALGLMPAISLLLIGSAVSVESLITSLLLLIVMPMALSRGVMRLNPPKSASTIVMNVAFAVLIFAVAGSNRDAFFGDLAVVAAIAVVCVIRTFGTGLGVEFVLRRLGMPKEDRVLSVLFSSYKNLGLTATLAIALFEPVVAVPATIGIVLEVVWVIFLLRFYPKVPR
jgi:BASS family bile acid:Na+ symporter